MSSATRNRVVVGVVLVGLAAGGGIAYSRLALHHGSSATTATGAAVPTGAPAAPGTTTPAAATPTRPAGVAAPSSSGVRAVSSPTSRPVETDPPAVVATDPPVAHSGAAVQVVVPSAEWDATSSSVQASAYVSGVVESDGTCTLVLTQGARRATSEIPAVPDATTTSCGVVAVPGDQLAPGTWQAVVTYRSPSSSGTSKPTTVVVP